MSDESSRVDRGGCWGNDPQNARVANRLYDSPGNRNRDLGFRLVKEVEDLEPTPAALESRRVLRGGGWSRVLRGGGWSHVPEGARVSNRGSVSLGYLGNGRLGVRLVEEVEDPELAPAVSGSNRVYRGGCWDFGPQLARVAYRDGITPGYRFYDLGFRLVEEVD
jgi:formylglycine-generating enzyme required for sulfatase activity